MEYKAPAVITDANALDTIQSGSQKRAMPSDGVQGSMIQPTVNAYEADE